MATNKGFGKRLGERMREMGYWPAGREMPDYHRFGITFKFNPSAVYRWLKGEVPRADFFYRLMLATGCQAHWLLLGEHVPEPTPGMSIPDYLDLLARDALKKSRKGKKPPKPTPIRGGSEVALPLPADPACEDEAIATPPHVEQVEKSQQIRDIMSSRLWRSVRPLHFLKPAGIEAHHGLAA